MAQPSEHLKLYDQLLRVSGQLLEWAETAEWDETVIARGGALQAEWNALQGQILDKEAKLLQAETSLSQLPYADDLRPVAERVAKMQQLTSSVLQERLNMLGKSMKGLQQTKAALHAYSDADEAAHTAYFFDEKK